MLNKSTQSDPLTQKMQQNEQLSDAIQDAKSHIETVSNNMRQLENKASEKELEISAYIDQKGPEREMAGLQKEHLVDLRQASREAANDRDAARSELDSLKAELARLQNKQQSVDNDLTEEDVLSHQATVKEAESRVTRIEQKIEEQQTIINQSTVDDSEYKALVQQREDLLSAISLGDEDESKLKPLDKEINTLKEQITKQQAAYAKQVERAKTSLAGLHRALQESKVKLENLIQQTPDVFEGYLMSEIEDISEQYLQHGQGLVDNYKRLISLQRIWANHTYKKISRGNVFPSTLHEMLIVLPNTNACKSELRSGVNSNIFFKNDMGFSHRIPVFLEEKCKEIESKGIEIPNISS